MDVAPKNVKQQKQYIMLAHMLLPTEKIKNLTVENYGKQKLIQVCWDSSNADTLMREERALKAAQQELKIDGEIITLNSYLKNGVVV